MKERIIENNNGAVSKLESKMFTSRQRKTKNLASQMVLRILERDLYFQECVCLLLPRIWSFSQAPGNIFVCVRCSVVSDSLQSHEL